MKKIFASMMMLAATSTGFAQQVTAPEPEFINSYCVLTSDSTFDALPKEDGMISKHQNKFGKFAKIAGAVGDLGFAGGMIGASTSGSASGIINGVRVMGTAAGVGQAADAVNTLAGAEGMDIAFAGGKSAYTVKNAIMASVYSSRERRTSTIQWRFTALYVSKHQRRIEEFNGWSSSLP